jgi:hypothetical protein
VYVLWLREKFLTKLFGYLLNYSYGVLIVTRERVEKPLSFGTAQILYTKIHVLRFYPIGINHGKTKRWAISVIHSLRRFTFDSRVMGFSAAYIITCAHYLILKHFTYLMVVYNRIHLLAQRTRLSYGNTVGMIYHLLVLMFLLCEIMWLER